MQNFELGKQNKDTIISMSELIPPFFIDRGTCIDRSVSSPFLNISCFSYVTRCQIGPFVSIGSRCSIGGFNHSISTETSSFGISDFFRKLEYSSTNRPNVRNTVIKGDVWVGDNAVILSGCTIAIGTVVGAGTVITKPTEPYGVYVGNPGKLLRFRFADDIVKALVESRWWESDPLYLAEKMDLPPSEFLEELARR